MMESRSTPGLPAVAIAELVRIHDAIRFETMRVGHLEEASLENSTLQRATLQSIRQNIERELASMASLIDGSTEARTSIVAARTLEVTEISPASFKIIRKRYLSLSQEALAKLFDVDYTTVFRWENGLVPVRRTIILALAGLMALRGLDPQLVFDYVSDPENLTDQAGANSPSPL